MRWPRSIQLFRCHRSDFGPAPERRPASRSSGDMADGAEDDVRVGLLRPDAHVPASRSQSQQRKRSNAGRTPEATSVMSRQPPRHQPSASSAASKNSGPAVASKDGKGGKSGGKDTKATTPTTPVSLDPIHRQKIQELRLRAAQATLKRQRNLRRENLHRHAYWLFRAFLWLAAIFSLTVLVVAFPLAVDPAMESNWRTFSEEPVACITTDIQIHHSRNRDGSMKGNDACTWTSCRHGCTGELFRCVQLYANVSRLPWRSIGRNATKQWKRLDASETKRTAKRSTSWVKSWVPSGKLLTNQTGKAAKKANPVHEMQRNHARGQFTRLLERLGPEAIETATNGSDGDALPDSAFAATNVRLMVNVRGCGYTLDCAEFNRTAAHVGSLIPCHLSGRGDVTVAVYDHRPEQNERIILYLFTVPAAIFAFAVFLLCCLHYQCCRPQWAAFVARNSPAEYSAARLVIQSGQLGGKLPQPNKTLSNIKYWAAPTDEAGSIATAQQPVQLT